MRRRPIHSRRLLLPGLALLLVACRPNAEASQALPSAGLPASSAVAPLPTATVLWPAPANPMQLTEDAGLVPEPKEHLAFHVHAHLDVFLDGAPVLVPAGIGINTEDPEVRSFTDPFGYGGIELCAQPCISPLHTHNEDGFIHTESAETAGNTLGQFFTEWDVELSDTCVGEHCSPTPIAVYVNGERYTGDPRAIELTDLKQIAIVIGEPPAVIPSTADFSKA